MKITFSKIFIFFVIVITALFVVAQTSCNSKNSNSNQDVIKEFISENDYTVFFAWASWCVGCKSQLKNDVLPYIENIPDGVGVILMYYGNKSDLTDIYKYEGENLKIYVEPSGRGMDKMSINNQYKALFDDYKKVNYVPVTIVCNKDFDIINTSKESRDSEYFREYLHFGSAIKELEEILK